MISSLDNKKVKELAKLHQKKYRQDSFLICEQELIEKARQTGHLDLLVYSDRQPFEFDNVLEVSKEVLNKISRDDSVAYLGVSKTIKESDDYGNRVLILDQLQDPLNIGRIMEAALLFGFDSLILSENCADIYNEKCLSNCKGGIYTLNIVHKNLETEIPVLQSKGYKVYATGLRNNTRELHEVEPRAKIAIIMGNEGSGVRSQLMDIADEIVKIDMRNIDSLNVSMAAAIIMYHFKNVA